MNQARIQIGIILICEAKRLRGSPDIAIAEGVSELATIFKIINEANLSAIATLCLVSRSKFKNFNIASLSKSRSLLCLVKFNFSTC